MKHSGEEHARIAAQGTVLRCQVGSGVHGLGLPGAADRDEMGICVEPPEYVIGLRTFEQYMHRTRPEHTRSGHDDLDLTVYSLRKWVRLALDGNPTVLLPLFVPESEIVTITHIGHELRANAARFLSRRAGERFLGYLRAQRDRMEGLRGGKHTNRPELVDLHGFDTKYAYHMVRLGLQGVELLETGRLTLPTPEPDRSWLLALRRGEYTRAEALARTGELEERLAELCHTSFLPELPDATWADQWLGDTYRRHWDESHAGQSGTRNGTATTAR
ncbi:DNA polymerase beta superfamily protein [Nocardiopsis sp. MG754419]|uniref:nucleotidyltransferase domain-containing protein n=1 Tax=Nocardiopsis sp. MG754419 TaxID=2259865 RepID=UPI001BABBA81|nr:nucleotidyltransferase domain-containing protein [Nocardiopsis sp. MG754419]MBR8740799.1 nucleotidyltransferase [Nocardiopsis sp. MG754419]